MAEAPKPETESEENPPGSLKPLYMVDAGAVGQTFAGCVIAKDLRGAHFTVADGEAVDSTNLNR